MHEQATLDFDCLPEPIVLIDYIRSTNVVINGNLLYAAKMYAHGNDVLEAFVALSGAAKDQHFYPPTRAGYMAITQHIDQNCGRQLSKSNIKFTIGVMLRLGYLKRLHEAGHGADASEYQALTLKGVEAMFERVHATHFRVCQGGEVQLIAARTC